MLLKVHVVGLFVFSYAFFTPNTIISQPYLDPINPTTIPTVPPVAPTIPTVPPPAYREPSTQSTMPERSQKDNKIPRMIYRFEATLYKSNGNTFSGEVDLYTASISQRIRRSNQVFIKEIPFHKIRSIRILEWDKQLLPASDNEKDKKAISRYIFIPKVFEIKTRGNLKTVYESPILSLNQFKLHTRHGHSMFYTFFHDAWLKKNSPHASYWQISQSTNIDGNKTLPNPHTITSILFNEVSPIVIKDKKTEKPKP